MCVCSASLSDGTREEMTEEELEERVSSNSRASGDTQDGNGEQVKGHHNILLLMYNDVIFGFFSSRHRGQHLDWIPEKCVLSL